MLIGPVQQLLNFCFFLSSGFPPPAWLASLKDVCESGAPAGYGRSGGGGQEAAGVCGGGPQGGNYGILEYISQTNRNFDFVDEELVFKYCDDASVLEIVNLLSIGLTSYNLKSHVASNIPTHNQCIPGENLQSQVYLDKINKWTQDNLMEMNVEKSKAMINFTDN